MKGKAQKLIIHESDLIATDGRDVFVLREGEGSKEVSGFDPKVDKVLLDFNSYSDVLGPLGYFHDGQEFTDFTGLTHILVSAVDANSDGITDTRFLVNGSDSIILLGVAPSDLTTGNLMGG